MYGNSGGQGNDTNTNEYLSYYEKYHYLITIEKVINLTRLNINQVYELPFDEYLFYQKYIYDTIKFNNKKTEMKNLQLKAMRKR